jgi:hypothetical protein
MNDEVFLGEKLKCPVSFHVDGVPEVAVNRWKHGDDRAALVVVGRIIDHLANSKLRHRELLLESAKPEPLLEWNDCDFAQSKGFRAAPKNRNLIDALEQQGRPGSSAR